MIPGRLPESTLFALLFSLLSNNAPAIITYDTGQSGTTSPKIQIALLLDVSNSMDGLITQAKDQLWNMVKVAGKATCNMARPPIEIALYEYGRTNNDPAKGYIKQVSPFTKDLDSLFNALYSLNTNGGSEYCTNVINTSLDELMWDTSKTSYKTIFIAGNESFLQGNISLSLICKKAKDKGVVINTIYCGDRFKGIAEYWQLDIECSNGSFNHIDQDAADPSIPTPYDTTLIVMNHNLNKTFIQYRGYPGTIPQYDTMATYDTKSIDKIIGWTVVRADTAFYNRSTWELVDAVEKDSTILNTLDRSKLPDSLKAKSPDELKAIIKINREKRTLIRKEIKRLDRERDAYIRQEKTKLSSALPQTLRSEIEKVIREQVRRFNMQIE